MHSSTSLLISLLLTSIATIISHPFAPQSQSQSLDLDLDLDPDTPTTSQPQDTTTINQSPDPPPPSLPPTLLTLNLLPQDPSLCYTPPPSKDPTIKTTTCQLGTASDPDIYIYTCTGAPYYRCQQETPAGDVTYFYRNCDGGGGGECELCESLKPRGEKYCGGIPGGVELFP